MRNIWVEHMVSKVILDVLGFRGRSHAPAPTSRSFTNPFTQTHTFHNVSMFLVPSLSDYRSTEDGIDCRSVCLVSTFVSCPIWDCVHQLVADPTVRPLDLQFNWLHCGLYSWPIGRLSAPITRSDCALLAQNATTAALLTWVSRH